MALSDDILQLSSVKTGGEARPMLVNVTNGMKQNVVDDLTVTVSAYEGTFSEIDVLCASVFDMMEVAPDV